MDNKFGKISRIRACAAVRTAKPFWKIYPLPPRTRSWCPLRKKTTVFRSCPLCRLWNYGRIPGIFLSCEGRGEPGSFVPVLEKIHKMDEGSAFRTIEIQVEQNAILYYYPQPVILFSGSAFDSTMTIRLE